MCTYLKSNFKSGHHTKTKTEKQKVRDSENGEKDKERYDCKVLQQIQYNNI